MDSYFLLLYNYYGTFIQLCIIQHTLYVMSILMPYSCYVYCKYVDYSIILYLIYYKGIGARLIALMNPLSVMSLQ